MASTVHYYDLILLCIAASLGVGAVIGYATPVALEVAIVALGFVAIAFILHALFVNGPVDEPDDLTEEVPIEKVPQVLSPLRSTE